MRILIFIKNMYFVSKQLVFWKIYVVLCEYKINGSILMKTNLACITERQIEDERVIIVSCIIITSMSNSSKQSNNYIIYYQFRHFNKCSFWNFVPFITNVNNQTNVYNSLAIYIIKTFCVKLNNVLSIVDDKCTQ